MAETAGAQTASAMSFLVGGIAWALLPFAFLAGLVWRRWHRAAVADLVLALEQHPTPAGVQEAIATALRDDEVELLFWLADEERYVDGDGRARDVTTRPDRAITVLERDGRRIAAIAHNPSVANDPALLEAVGAAAALALHNVGLQAELRAQLTEVRASRVRLLAAGDEQRRRIERDLHDGAQQRILGIRLALRMAQDRLRSSATEIDSLLTEADAEAAGALEELRSLARGVHPAVLAEQGLEPALAALARRMPVPVELDVCPERMPPAVEATAYYVASEALANIAKHARATQAAVAVTRSDGQVAVVVSDDGNGGAEPDGAGLRGLRDRVETLDGHLWIESAPGLGTSVRAAIPCA